MKVYYPDGRVEIVELAPGGTAAQLAQLQELVGGYIEMIACGGMWMVINEEGKLKGLPLNPNDYMFPGDVVVGPAVLCSRWELESREEDE